jgi:hypothetical protein
MAGALVLALAAAGCEESCDPTYCADRPDPSTAQAKGWKAQSLRPRLATARRKLGRRRVAAVAINQWGDLAVQRGDEWAYTSRVDGEPVEHPDELGRGPGGEPFALRRIDPAFPERVMRAIIAHEPSATFYLASARVGFAEGPTPGSQPKLRWSVTARSART